MAEANYINHITIVGDDSASMRGHAAAFVKVYDNLVAHLAERSKVHGQETRITTYLFNSAAGIRCVTYDKDVLRVPSIRDSYRPAGMTPLVSAVLLAIADQRMIPQKYGSHAFLDFVLTDGEENQGGDGGKLSRTIATAPDNETYAVFVPDQMAVAEAKRFGFPAGNITVWDTSRSTGTEDVGAAMRAASDVFMEGRSHGVHGYRSGSGLFKLRDFTAADIAGAVPPLTQGSYFFKTVLHKERIDEFVMRETGRPYVRGRCYYQFTKTETIQSDKNIAVEVTPDKGEVKVYEGIGARTVLGLPSDHSVRVAPDQKPGCVIFVQSTSYNRNLMPGTRLLLLR